MSKTFKELSPEEIKKYQNIFVQREKEKKEKLIERFYRAWELVKKISEILHEKYQAKEVLIFGSLTERDYFNEWSDIDIAVSGIPDELYLKAVSEVLDMSEDFEVDIVDLKDCSESLRRIIIEKGVKV